MKRVLEALKIASKAAAFCIGIAVIGGLLALGIMYGLQAMEVSGELAAVITVAMIGVISTFMAVFITNLLD